MVVPPSSVGDIIAICQVVTKAALALKKSNEQIEEYEALIKEFDELHEVLRSMDTIDTPSLSKDALITYSHIVELGKTCGEQIEAFQKKNAPPKIWYRKVIWSFLVASRSDSLRRNLRDRRRNINTLLGVLSHRHNDDRLDRLTNRMESHHMVIRDLLPGPEGITLIDAIGQPIRISMEFCRTYEILSEAVKLYYRHQPRCAARAYVEREDYQLVHGDEYNVLLKSTWESVRRNGVVLSMSMILRRRGEMESKCPRCGTVSLQDESVKWATCECGCHFQVKRILDQARSANALSSNIIQDRGSLDEEIISPAVSFDLDSSTVAPQQQTFTIADDWKEFKHISLFLHIEGQRLPVPMSQPQIPQILAAANRHARVFDSILAAAANEARNSVNAKDIRRLQTCREQLLALQKKALDENNNWSHLLQDKIWPQEVLEVITKECDRFQDYATTFDQLIKFCEDNVQRLSALNMIGPQLTNHEADVRGSAMRVMQAAGIEAAIFVNGHNVDLWALYCFVKKYSGQIGSPQIFSIAGVQLGLPSDGGPGQVGPSTAATLQEYYNKFVMALESARDFTLKTGMNSTNNATNSNPNPTVLNPTPDFSNHSNAHQVQQNSNLLQNAKQTYPHFDFSNFTSEMITNFPSARFEQSLREYIAARTNSEGQDSTPTQRGAAPSRPNSGMPGAGQGAPPMGSTLANQDPLRAATRVDASE